ncbi:HET-domain-containing protein [Lentinus tigrinus ALCF2SS1-7]|uniref:HET-domain-containing protein n=1 Tax=Lentinus tigrinus ALCF2SS1-6 TaxID=1328759 RepID=A0A5C2RPS0_9APHY|nr:HET-domain-containing protein [Lentinus tigrinus ALCF2SS1-6]RPD68485.1 HET-domain-containing protein [Lentinus tigrinus ALCF2SS1-7]
MWLLHTEKLQLRWFPNPNEVSYAALSHVWNEDEQTFQDTPHFAPAHGSLARGAFRNARDRVFRRPSLKIRNACVRARNDGFRWLWVDTCCIDKTNSTELSEAINSMYVWYRTAAMCYALLDDVPSGEDPHAPNSAFRRSRWFTRGWTLQELIAPASVIFLADDWTIIGPKWRLAPLLEKVTGIDRRVLTHKRPLDDVSIACRMSWAAGRKTRRIEDEAYSLMGLFGVYMPTIYGEGKHAFVRLQEEIIKKSPDQSIFAWGRTLDDHAMGTFVSTAREHDYAPSAHLETLLAPSPAEFAACANISPISHWELAERLRTPETVPEYTNTSSGIRTTLPMVSIAHTSSVDAALAFLACEDGKGRLVALYLRSHSRTSASNKYFVGGYIACGGRRNHYYRATRLRLPALNELLSPYHQTSKNGSLPIQPSLREVHIHSHPDSSSRLRLPGARDSDSSAVSSIIFFEPPCTIVLSQRSIKRLRKMGYVEPKIPDGGFRLQTPGDYRSISFLGPVSFTVHLGVCPLDLSSTPTQTSQLWASVRFDSEVDDLLWTGSSGTGTLRRSGSKENSYASRRTAPTRDVNPDESMLVQTWKNACETFGSRGKQVRLTFSYPWSCVAEHSMAEVYELDIRYEGYYSQHPSGVGMWQTAGTATTVSSAG